MESDLSPPTDDRPYFFYFNKIGSIFGFFTDQHRVLDPAGWILIGMSLSLLILVVLFLILPMTLNRNWIRSLNKEDQKSAVATLALFTFAGLAFITVEIALLQQLTLYLGHPSHALMVILFSLLLSAACGAAFYQKFLSTNKTAFVNAAPLIVCAFCILYAMVLPAYLRSWIVWPLPARIFLAVLVVAFCGIPMGLVIPAGVRLAGERLKSIVPWAWGLNGATSVLGTIIATISVIHWGGSKTLLLGGFFYVVCAGCLYSLGQLTVKK
jgi:hypothetical protein